MVFNGNSWHLLGISWECRRMINHGTLKIKVDSWEIIYKWWIFHPRLITRGYTPLVT
jgi:hypothetical protein